MVELNTQYADIPRSALAGTQAGLAVQRNALLQSDQAMKEQEYGNKRRDEAQMEAALMFGSLSKMPPERQDAEYPVLAQHLQTKYSDIPEFKQLPPTMTPEVRSRLSMWSGAMERAAEMKRGQQKSFGPVFKHPETNQLVQYDAYGQMHSVPGSAPSMMQADEEKDIIDQRTGAVVRKGAPSPTKQIANYEAWTKLSAAQGIPIDNDVAVLFKLPGAMTSTDAIAKIAAAKMAKTNLDKTSMMDSVLASLPAFQSSGVSIGQKMDPAMKQEALDAYDRLINHLETFASGTQPKATQGGGVDASSFAGKPPGTYKSKSGKRIRWDGTTVTPLGE